jgi:hypothetical protein
VIGKLLELGGTKIDVGSASAPSVNEPSSFGFKESVKCNRTVNESTYNPLAFSYATSSTTNE